MIIVIATTPGREAWLRDCMASIERRSVLVLSDFTFELGKIRHVLEHTDAERFMLLHDTCVVKDQRLFEMCEEFPMSVAFSSCPVKFGMYLGVYTRATLEKLDIPQPVDKEEAIVYERTWNDAYSACEPDAPLLFDDFTDGHSTRTEVRHGRVNLVLENDYLTKYKGTWR